MDSIASAVVLPDQDSDSPPSPTSSPAGTKRRQSSVSIHEAKRARLDDFDAAAQRRESVTSQGKTPAPLPKGRERGRERRLFGAALGALSQNSTSAAQKRRIEIEKRQRDQRKLEDAESEQRKQERLARRKGQRWKEQRHFEKVSMRARHDNMVAMAHFLRTSTEPRLYYKPWETTPEEDDRIRSQIAEAQDMVRREREAYEFAAQDHEEHAERNRPAANNARTSDILDDPHSGRDHDIDHEAANGVSTNGSIAPPKHPGLKSDYAEAPMDELTDVKSASRENTIAGHAAIDDVGKEVLDENGEEVVEAAEDTVIY